MCQGGRSCLEEMVEYLGGREREREARWGNETTLLCHISSPSSISLPFFLPSFQIDFKIIGLLNYVFVDLLRPLMQGKLAQSTHVQSPNLSPAPPSLLPYPVKVCRAAA